MLNTKSKRFKFQDDDKLFDLYRSGMPMTKIGEEFGLTDNAVRYRLWNLGIDTNFQGESIQYACDQCGREFHCQHWRTGRSELLFCSPECHILHQKQTGKLASLTQEKYDELRKTMSVRAIARMHGCHHSSLRKYY